MSRYIKINKTDVSNGPGVRHSIFLSGCDFHCKGCFNEVTWDFKTGNLLDWLSIWDFITPPILDQNVSGISILGGEPLHPKNIEATINICACFRRYENTILAENPNYKRKTIWVWTGYTIEELFQNEEQSKILEYIDVLVDGRFDENLKDPNLLYRGSSNQRIFDVKKIRKWKNCINLKFFKFIFDIYITKFIIPTSELDKFK